MAKESLKQQTKKGLYWRFSEQFTEYGMQFIIGIVMARLLTPSDYGITALPAVFLAVAGALMNAGFMSALIRKPQVTEEDLSTAFYYSISVGVISYAVLFFLSPWIADFYKTPVLKDLVRVTALSFLWAPLSTPQGVILNRQLNFKTPTKIGVTCKFFSGVIGIFFAFIGYGLWALVISGVLASILSTILYWFAVKWYPKARFSKESFKYLWGFGNKMMFSSLVSTLYTNITPVFIGKYYSPGDLGVFKRAQGYAAMPSRNVTGVLQNVTFPVLSKMQGDDVRLANNYRRMLRVSAFIIFPIMLMVSALARPLVLVLITAKWEASIYLLQIICFAMMWYPIHAINLNLLQVKGRSDLFLKLEIIKKIIGLCVIIITLPMGLVTICYGRILTSLGSLFINTYYTGKMINVGFIKQMKDILPIFGLSLIMFVGVLAFNSLFDNMWFQLICGGLVGIIIYIGGAFLFHFSEIEDVKYLLKK